MGAPMPPGIRSHLRAQQHPALAAPCTHCGARTGQPCRLRRSRAAIPAPHDSRQAAADLIATAVCPACQVEQGIPCRYDNGQPYPGIHPQRSAA